MKLRGNVSLILGLLIPVAMILFVAASIYLPSMFIKPGYNFLYAVTDDYYYSNEREYSMGSDGMLQRFARATTTDSFGRPIPEERLYMHDVARNESSEVNYDQMRNLRFTPGEKSPDGFTLEHGSHSDGFFPFFFWSESDYGTMYLTRDSYATKLDLKTSGRYYDNSFRVLGWIEQ